MPLRASPFLQYIRRFPDPMPTIDISIIVPFYDVETTVAECLESILTQDYPHFEVICIDDKSPDGSRAIVDLYAAQDKRVVVVEHAENKGLGPARNTGVAAARGDYIMFLDSDDRLSFPGALRRILEVAIETGSEVVAGSAAALHEDGSLRPWDRMFEQKYRDEGRLVHDLPGAAAYSALIRVPGANHLPLRSWGYLFNREYYLSLGILHPAGAHEDIGHNALVAFAARNVHYCSDIIVDYRIRSGSISRSQWNAVRIDGYMGVWAHFRDNHAKIGLAGNTGNAALHVIRNWCWMVNRNGLAEGDEDYAVTRLAEVMGDVGPDSDPEMLGAVTAVLHKSLKKLGMPPETFSTIVDHLPTPSLILGAQYTIGLRRLAGKTPHLI